MKTSKLAVLLTATALLLSATGCGKKVPYEVHDMYSKDQQASPNAPKEASCCYVVEGYHENPIGESSVSQISILKSHMAVVSLCNLEAGRQYTAEFCCCDASGKEIYKSDKPLLFTPSSSAWYVWVTMRPDYKMHKAGKWKWVVSVKGVGKFTTELGVLPPTPDELTDLARYEKARENVFRAFSRYWLGIDGTFHTTICYQIRIDDYGQRLSVGAYVQVAGLEWSMAHGALSEADMLNGVTFRGEVSFSFRVFRYYREQGWTDWQDCQQLPYAFTKIFGNVFSGVPAELDQKVNLTFYVMERDGNWFVTTPAGDEFVNGKFASDRALYKNIAPLEAYARSIATGAKSFTRESYRAMGEDARNNPAVVEQSAIATMTMLRGRNLIQ